MQTKFIKSITVLTLFTLFTSAVFAKHHKHKEVRKTKHVTQQAWTITDLIDNAPRPYAIGHRGLGENLDPDSALPIENTIAAVVKGFEAGLPIVEVDVVLTKDGHAVAVHDDFLADYTCINTLTYSELTELHAHIPKLKEVLRKSKKWAKHSPQLSGLVNIEIKPPSPLCDPDDSTEIALVEAVHKAISRSKTHEQVIIESFSPSIIKISELRLPEVKHNISTSAVQYLSREQVAAYTGLTVTDIDKDAQLNLQWFEIGPIYRLPGYTSIDEFVYVNVASNSTFITLDINLLKQIEAQLPGAASGLVGQLKQMGFVTTAFTVNTQDEWAFLTSVGIDGIFINNVDVMQ